MTASFPYQLSGLATITFLVLGKKAFYSPKGFSFTLVALVNGEVTPGTVA